MALVQTNAMLTHLTFFLLGIILLIIGSEGFIAATQRMPLSRPTPC